MARQSETKQTPWEATLRLWALGAKVARLSVRPSVWRALLRTRTAAAVEHVPILNFLQPQTVIDVGANKGQFALIARSVCPTCRIIAFEPLPSEADKFEINFEGVSGVQLHRLALGADAGLRQFYVTSRPDSSSLLVPGAGQNDIFGVKLASTTQVTLKRLDSVVPLLPDSGTTLLKIDVQGAEADVIEGATGILPSISYVYAEASFVELYEGQPLATDLIHFMREKGFVLRGVYNQSATSRGPVQADLLFEQSRGPN